VHYCATCDGAMYFDANILVVGGGESAAEEAVFLTRYAKHVTIINRHDYLKASKLPRMRCSGTRTSVLYGILKYERLTVTVS